MKNKFSLVLIALLVLNAALLAFVLSRRHASTATEADTSQAASEMAGDGAPAARGAKQAPQMDARRADSLRQMAEQRRPKLETPPLVRMVEDPDGAIAQSIPQLVERIEAAESIQEKIALMRQLAANPRPEMVTAVRRLMQTDDPRVRATALSILLGYTSTDAFKLAAEAMDDPDPRVRATAIAMLPIARPENPVDIIEPVRKLVNDPEEGIRQYFEPVTAPLPIEERLMAVAEGLNSPYPDVVSVATQYYQALGGHLALEELFRGLDHSEPECRKLVDGTIYHMIGLKFENREVAETWWGENKSRFDQNLFLITD